MERLRDDGHAVVYVLEMEPGVSDDEVIQRANREAALLLTADKDFGELVFRQGRIAHGVVLIRLSGLPPSARRRRWPRRFRGMPTSCPGTPR